MVLVRGVDTGAAADGQPIQLEQVFSVNGTYRYNTADGGTNTVLVLEPIDQEAVREALRALPE